MQANVSEAKVAEAKVSKANAAVGGGNADAPDSDEPEGRAEAPGGEGGGPPGRPGLIKILKQAGLDNRSEAYAPAANESDTSSGRIARWHGGPG